MIEVVEKAACCGCTACASVCPQKCISMSTDKEGFLYPHVNKEACIDCGLCEKVCPVINKAEAQKTEQHGFLVRHRRSDIRRESTSGGAFTAFAQVVLDHNGKICGASFDEHLHVCHIMVDNEQELNRFRNSKYVQSNMNGCYSKVQHELKTGKLVCFSGTPCQVEGLKRFLRREYENLILIDTVCRAVPSPLVFEKYKEAQEKWNGSPVENVRFRDKHFGYSYSTLNLILRDTKNGYHRGIESDPWLRAFFSEICDRPSCHSCKFRSRYRESDITMWDCFNVRDYYPSWDDGEGVTRVLVHSQKGVNLINKIEKYAEVIPVSPDAIVKNVKEMQESPDQNPRRQLFMEDVIGMDGRALFEKYFPIKTKHKLKHIARVVLAKTGLYNVIKYGIRSVKGR